MNVYLGGLYKEVQYIQSSGTQYIDTGYIPSNNTKIEMSMGGFNSSTSSNSLFGARYSWNVDASIGRGFGWSVNASTSPYGYGGMFGRRYSAGNDNFNVFSWGDGGNHILSLDQSGFYQDGVKKYTPNTVTFTSPVNLYIFALNDNGTLAEKTNYKLYHFKIRDSGTLVRDFIPCYRVSDNVIGLFDKVENKFYTNAGTGTFTKGADVKVFQPELKNAYIGEVWTPGSNTVAYYPLTASTTTTDIKNGNNMTNYNANFGTYQGVSCAYGTGNNQRIETPTFTGSNVKTISFWTYWSGSYASSNSSFALIFSYGTGTTNKFQEVNRKANTTLGIDDYDNDKHYSTSQITGRWFNNVITFDGTTTNWYIDGSLIQSYTGNYFVNGYFCFFVSVGNKTGIDGYLGGLSEFIVENKTWTATQVSDYYNNTKSNYGL